MRSTLLKYLAMITFLGAPLCFAQTGLMVHVTRQNSDFESKLIITNTSPLEQEIILFAYDERGNNVANILGTISQKGEFTFPFSDVFGTAPVSHFEVEAGEEIDITVTYRAKRNDSSPVHVGPTDQAWRSWKIFPGNWAQVWDGFAFFNRGLFPASVEVQQVGASGNVRASQTLDFVSSKEKKLFVLSNVFQPMENTHYLVRSDQPLSMLALRGDLSSRFLWQNRAVPVLDEPELDHLISILGLWELRYMGDGEGQGVCDAVSLRVVLTGIVPVGECSAWVALGESESGYTVGAVFDRDFKVFSLGEVDIFSLLVIRSFGFRSEGRFVLDGCRLVGEFGNPEDNDGDCIPDDPDFGSNVACHPVTGLKILSLEDFLSKHDGSLSGNPKRPWESNHFSKMKLSRELQKKLSPIVHAMLSQTSKN